MLPPKSERQSGADNIPEAFAFLSISISKFYISAGLLFMHKRRTFSMYHLQARFRPREITERETFLAAACNSGDPAKPEPEKPCKIFSGFFFFLKKGIDSSEVILSIRASFSYGGAWCQCDIR